MIRQFIVVALTCSILVSQTPWAAGQQSDSRGQAVLAKYLKIQEALSQDSLAEIPKAANELVKAATAAQASKESKNWDQVRLAAKKLKTAQTLADARKAFKELSTPMIQWAKSNPPAGVTVMHCPMAKASWIQKEGEVSNPYFGKEMLTCGEKVE